MIFCKVNYYKVDYRNAKKMKEAQWEKVPYYTVDDTYSIWTWRKICYDAY